jgi:hypothetical protein
MKPRQLRTILLVGFLAFCMQDMVSAREKSEPASVPTLAVVRTKEKQNRWLVSPLLEARYGSHCQQFDKAVMGGREIQSFARECLYLVIYDIANRDEMMAGQREVVDAPLKQHQVRFAPAILVLLPGGEALLHPEGDEGTPAAMFASQLAKLQQVNAIPQRAESRAPFKKKSGNRPNMTATISMWNSGLSTVPSAAAWPFWGQDVRFREAIPRPEVYFWELKRFNGGEKIHTSIASLSGADQSKDRAGDSAIRSEESVQ